MTSTSSERCSASPCLEIMENGVFGRGARFEIFIPQDCLLL